MPQDQKSYLLSTPEALEKEKLRLAKQADLLFNLERPILEPLARGKTFKTLLDLGCGNAFYTSQLNDLFHPFRVLGYERNKNLIEQARSTHPNIEITEGDLTDLPALKNLLLVKKPDLINLRFVLQHMRPNERSLLLGEIKSNIDSKCTLIITEPDDSEIKITPHSENIESLIERTMSIQAERGGDRSIAGKLNEELKVAGFSKIEKFKYTLSTESITAEQLVEVILPIWKSYRPNESKEALNERITEAESFILEQSKNKNLHFEFPLYIFIATPQ